MPKPEPTYIISRAGSRLLDEYRGDRTFGDLYLVSKDEDTAYEVVLALGAQNKDIETCSCPGFRHHYRRKSGSTCKHIRMVEEWLRKEGNK